MKILTAIFLIATLTIPIVRGNLVLIAFSYGGKYYDFECSDAVVEATPEWKEGEEPALSPGKAVDAARVELKVLLPDADDWKLSGVEIKVCGTPGHWYYLVQFVKPSTDPGNDASAKAYLHPFSIPVLMDGTVITPNIN